MKTRTLLTLLAAFFILHSPFFISRSAAQATGQMAVITGRVSDAVANTYLNNAEVRVAGSNNMVYTRDDGTYRIEAPAGSVTITVTYANSRPATRTINAAPGAGNTLDFVLQPLMAVPTTVTTGTAGATGDEIIQLARFTVTDERIGQAKVIMEQRAADNAKTIISTEQFGELTQGSVGEFMKYMPGITLDLDDEGEVAYARIGGLDPKYAGFSQDGISLAAANESQSRANNFSQMSITSIESIEFNQTLLARMPANTPAGQFELKTRYAFNRKKPEIGFDLGFDGTGNTIELGRGYMPDNRKHMRTSVGGRIYYGGAFFNKRLGIEASISRYEQYRNDQRHEILYTYPVNGVDSNGNVLNPDTIFVERNGHIEALQGPTIRRLTWLDGPRIRTNEAASLSIDYKITPSLTFSLRSQYAFTENEYFNIYYHLLGENRDDNIVANQYSPAPGLDPTSTLTRWVVNPVSPNSLESVLLEGPSSRVARSTNYLASPRLYYKNGPLEVNLTTAYSTSRADYSDGGDGRFRGAPNRLAGIGWIATRPSTDSPEWTLTQTAGSHWNVPENLSRASTYLMGIYCSDPHFVENTQLSAKLDLTYAARVFDHPVTFRAGGSWLKSDYARLLQRKDFNYIGPEGTQMAALYPYADNYFFNVDLGGKSGNVNEQNWPVVNQDQLWALYRSHPEWFVSEALSDVQNALTNRNNLTERIQALYGEFTTRIGSRASLNLGVRYEGTSADILFTRMLSNEEMDYARTYLSTPEEIAMGKYNTGTVEGKMFQYNYGQRGTRTQSYGNMFLSGGLKYDFTKNLRLQLSFSQAILRPDYGNLSGTITYPEYYPTNLWVPNPKLKPEKTTKFYAGLQYYLNPSGIIELSAYRLDIGDMQMNNMQITSEQASYQLGYSIDELLQSIATSAGFILDEEAQVQMEVLKGHNPVVYRSIINAAGTRHVYGVTLHYDQQLTFLPGFLKGLGIFGSFTTASLTNAQIDEEKIGRASKSANGGVKYRYGRFDIQLRGTWTDDALKYITRPYADRRWMENDYRYQKARFVVDLSGNWRFNDNLSLSFSIRNLTAEPYIYYSNVPNRLCWYSVPDTIWNLSIKGKY